MSIAFNKEIRNYVWSEKENMSINKKIKKESLIKSKVFGWDYLMCIFY